MNFQSLRFLTRLSLSVASLRLCVCVCVANLYGQQLVVRSKHKLRDRANVLILTLYIYSMSSYYLIRLSAVCKINFQLFPGNCNLKLSLFLSVSFALALSFGLSAITSFWPTLSLSQSFPSLFLSVCLRLFLKLSAVRLQKINRLHHSHIKVNR